MKINLDKLRKLGWHLELDLDGDVSRSPVGVLELLPPPITTEEHRVLMDMTKRFVTTSMGRDLVAEVFYSTVGKAMLLEAME